MRGRDIIRFVGEMHGLNPATIESRSAALAERLSLADAMEEFAENYSRGMKKKLGLICALLHEPALVVLDEPTNGLDPHGTMVLHELMREIAKSDRTVFFSTHLLDQAERLCSRVAVISHGQLAAEGTLVELQNRFGASESLESLFFRLTESAAEQTTRHMLQLARSSVMSRLTAIATYKLFARTAIRRLINRSSSMKFPKWRKGRKARASTGA